MVLDNPSKLPAQRRSWKDALYAYRKQTIELLFQRIIQAAGLKQCPVKSEVVTGLRVGERVAVSGVLPGRLPRGQTSGAYQRPSRLRPMAHS